MGNLANCCSSKKNDDNNVFDDVLNVAPPPVDKMDVVRRYIKDHLDQKNVKADHIGYTKYDQNINVLCDFNYFLEVYRAIFFFKKMHF